MTSKRKSHSSKSFSANSSIAFEYEHDLSLICDENRTNKLVLCLKLGREIFRLLEKGNKVSLRRENDKTLFLSSAENSFDKNSSQAASSYVRLYDQLIEEISEADKPHIEGSGEFA